MFSLLLPYYFIVVCSVADDLIEERTPIFSQENEHYSTPSAVQDVGENKNIESSLQKIENLAASAEKSRREGILPTDHADKLHSRIVETLEDITEQLKHKTKAYKFLNSKGVDRIITPIIGTTYEPLKKQLLIVIKTLFNVAPITTKALIPISVVDKLLDIFEHDDNLALKAHALDIMYIWLPNNPTVQARVMRRKGLEAFYNQISKLDNTAIYTLLDLFHKILKEHIDARNSKSQRNKEDYERMQLYQTIGLIERMATPQVCNGLFNILEALMTFSNDDKQVSILIFELVKNMKTFCLKLYKGKDKAIQLFEGLENYFMDPQNVDLLHSLELNMTEVIVVVKDFVKNLKDSVRDEF
ncbi:uncharacterized protein LOC123877679 [Maniola jurtina]|uniref:uncharacterized protein LOC123877679 n=1 Tax=Maniola jurtina TaxID=191418 RepID=UPI001E685F96|nr:uncharacterized protein LOC123877679 [Maniola jurtina]